MTGVVVIGGGAAGVCAAIEAARRGARVTVLERGPRPLRKLCVTGNGRGNLMNTGAPVYYGDTAFALKVLESVPLKEVRAFLEGVGATLFADAEGRVYPASLMAGVVADALMAEMARLGVTMLTDARAAAIQREEGGYVVHAARAAREPERIKKSGKMKPGAVVGESPIALRCDRVILCAGGAASPAHGTDGTAYALLRAHGHRLVPPRPALCALLTDPQPIAGLSGQRVRARLTLLAANGEALRQSEGEALFAEDGVSGIAAMQLARFVEDGCKLRVDMRRAILGEANADAAAWLRARAPSRGGLPLNGLLTGAASPALSCALLKYAGLAEAAAAGGSADEDDALGALASAIEGFTLRVLGTRGFSQAQVTAGGLDASQFDPATMQSRLAAGLYAAGEALDVDGDCGGFNLMFAFASGMLAGRSAGA